MNMAVFVLVARLLFHPDFIVTVFAILINVKHQLLRS
jgi:hypothetical protein